MKSIKQKSPSDLSSHCLKNLIQKRGWQRPGEHGKSCENSTRCEAGAEAGTEGSCIFIATL